MKKIGFAAAVLLLCLSRSSSAALIVINLGAQDFNDGDALTLIQYQNAAAGEASPFNEFKGFDSNTLAGFNETFTFGGYGPLTNIVSANLTAGFYDHDSAAAGSQVGSFTLDGAIDLTTELNNEFEASGGGQPGPFLGEYNIYTLNLAASTFGDLADGSASFALQLQNGQAGANSFLNNGAGIDFATLTIEATVVPEPSTFVVWGVLGVMGIGVWRRRRNK